MDRVEISLDDAKKIIVSSQLLGNLLDKKLGKTIDIFDQLGYIQIDTISTINRAHHHSIWVRNLNYKEEELYDFQSKEKKIFEYWTHAMSYLPMSDYRFMLPKMENFKNPSSSWVKNHLSKSKNILKEVLKRIEAEGALSSKDFKSDGRKGNGWWDWKPAKFALEYLFWRGDLMVKERKGFRKFYDLRERVLPGNINLNMPDKNELGDFLVNRALLAMGIATEKEIASFMQSSASRDSELLIADKDVINNSIQRLIDSKTIIEVYIKNGPEKTYYSLIETINMFGPDEKIDPVIHFLSPFDNMIIDRKRTNEIFNFNYSLECYKPASKREYGYFVLPILYENDLVGRMDPKADRKKKKLYINNLVFEEQFDPDSEFLNLLADKFVVFAKFNDCESIDFNSGSHLNIYNKLKLLIKDRSLKRN